MKKTKTYTTVSQCGWLYEDHLRIDRGSQVFIVPFDEVDDLIEQLQAMQEKLGAAAREGDDDLR